MIKHNLLKLLIHLLLFPQDHIPLSLDSRLVQLRVLQNIAQDINSLRDVLVETFRIVDGLFSGCVGVQVGTDVFNF